MRRSSGPNPSHPVRCCSSLPPKAAALRFRRPAQPERIRINRQEGVMVPKLVVAVILSAIVFAYPPTQGYAIPIFILLVAIAFVIEGVKVVPQQNAWVVERLG